MHDPCEPHLADLKWILRYVRVTLDHGLQLRVSTTTQLTPYTDVDWVGPSSTKSVAKLATDKGKELFIPSIKLVLEEISSTIESKCVRRSLPFSNKDLDNERTATLFATV
ncbi:ribonuclease H-like domain-containing protein [Tanacetum coccineum]